ESSSSDMSSSSSRPVDRNSSKASDHDAACPIANFHPDDVWGDFFLNYTPVHELKDLGSVT
ncbi:hypothetical protein Ancab_019917, partial [Ancistrocladus abbreviatus]